MSSPGVDISGTPQGMQDFAQIAMIVFFEPLGIEFENSEKSREKKNTNPQVTPFSCWSFLGKLSLNAKKSLNRLVDQQKDVACAERCEISPCFPQKCSWKSLFNRSGTWDKLNQLKNPAGSMGLAYVYEFTMKWTKCTKIAPYQL